MKKITLSSALLIGLTCLATGQAEARRIRLPIHIPTGETIVLVKDLPNIEALHRDDGKYVDLGYRFTATGGEWVGYVGSDSSYLKLDEVQLAMLLTIGGVEKLPPVPARPVSSSLGGSSYMVLMAIGILALLGKALSFLKRGASSAIGAAASASANTRRSRSDADDEPSAADMAKYDQLIAKAATQYANPGPVQRTSPPAGRASFGRR